MGRFFDAVAALCGVRQVVNYEAQAAIEFEALADLAETGVYDIIVKDQDDDGSLLIDPRPLIEQVMIDVQQGTPVTKISARFHNSIAKLVLELCEQIRREHGVNQVVLSGGVWQNQTLLQKTHDLLIAKEYQVYIHRKVPTNDGGLSLGQAVVAIHRMMR
jgi:hydrogenase maturation protein HypF